MMEDAVGWLDDRAVSDVIAFVLVFSIIITSVALVYGTGFSSITQISEGEQKTNAVRAFEALDLSLDDLNNGQATRRGSTINLGGGRLQVADGPDVEVFVDEGSGFDSVYANNTGSFEYAFEETSVAWENGGIFRQDRGNSVNLGRAEMTCDKSGPTNRAVVSVVLLRTTSGALGADGNVEITMDKRSKELAYADYDGSKNVRVTLSGSDFQEAWDRHMDDEMGWDSPSSGVYNCDNVEEVVVRVTVIDIVYDTP